MRGSHRIRHPLSAIRFVRSAGGRRTPPFLDLAAHKRTMAAECIDANGADDSCEKVEAIKKLLLSFFGVQSKLRCVS